MGHQGHKTGGRQKGSRNKRKVACEEAAAEVAALMGEAIPDAFAGDAPCWLRFTRTRGWTPLARKDAAKAALPYEKSRPVTVTLANAGAEPLKVRGALRPPKRQPQQAHAGARGTALSVQHGIPPAALL